MPSLVSKIFNSKTIAIVGATDKSHWPRNIFTNLTKSGFPGKIFPVNPKRDKIFEVPCYPDLSSLPVPADLALMIIPAPAIEDALRQGLKNGLKAAIVYASGFGDGGHKQSIKRGEAFREALKEIDIPICGPNCMGLAGIRQKLYCYPHEHVRNMEPGTVALITQSGGTLSYFTRTGQERGLRFSYAISSGNEISLDLADYMDFVIDDPNTKQICLFIEGIRKPASFMRAAAKALKVGKPIIAIKTGKSMKSREAAQSHSGAVAGDYMAYEALCERYGIINCKTLEEMIEMTLAFQQERLPRGPRIAFMTTSGGTVDLLHDYCEDEGAVVPELSAKTVEAVRPFVPADCHIRNPIDTGAPVGQSGRSAPAEICKLFAADDGIDMVAWCNNLPGSARSAGALEEVQKLVESTEKPVISFARMPQAEIRMDNFSETIKDSFNLFSNSHSNINLKLIKTNNDIFFQFDRFQLTQAFNNLIKNAVEAVSMIPNPFITINYFVKNKKLFILIKDNGIGVNDKMVRKFFEPYYTTKEKGTGLGLSICKKIIEDHGGKIFIKKNINAGSTITLTLNL